MNIASKHIIRDAWRLAKPYWTSKEKWSAWGLLLAVVTLTLANVYVSVRINALYLNQMLQIRWRRWLTSKYLAAWLADRAYYYLQLGNTTDNPDQRISEDLNQFTSYQQQAVDDDPSRSNPVLFIRRKLEYTLPWYIISERSWLTSFKTKRNC